LLWYVSPVSDMPAYTGGCLCGSVRYEAMGEPSSQGLCFCDDCRRASGSLFVPFLCFARSAVRISGSTATHTIRGGSGADTVRNFCAACRSLVFGTPQSDPPIYTIYGGSLDDPSQVRPRIALFARALPPWLVLPVGMQVFTGGPDGPSR
jgi:hypothetical protein